MLEKRSQEIRDLTGERGFPRNGEEMKKHVTPCERRTSHQVEPLSQICRKAGGLEGNGTNRKMRVLGGFVSQSAVGERRGCWEKRKRQRFQWSKTHGGVAVGWREEAQREAEGWAWVVRVHVEGADNEAQARWQGGYPWHLQFDRIEHSLSPEGGSWRKKIVKLDGMRQEAPEASRMMHEPQEGHWNAAGGSEGCQNAAGAAEGSSECFMSPGRAVEMLQELLDGRSDTAAAEGGWRRWIDPMERERAAGKRWQAGGGAGGGRQTLESAKALLEAIGGVGIAGEDGGGRQEATGGTGRRL